MESLVFSSPSWTPPPEMRWSHDVFLCFRGEDTRKNFADHLFTALHQEGILTYLDHETLPLGDSITPSLCRAIEESRIYVIVFSENYADSSWCLNELHQIMEFVKLRGQLIVPIFYHVDLYELRKPSGRYAQGLISRLDRGSDHQRVERWIEAMVHVSNLPGWELNNNPDSRESVCIKQVVDTILNKLSPNKHLSGLGTRLQDLKLGGDDSCYNNSKNIKRSMSSSRPSNYISTSSSKWWNHDVFLSFRREDTGNNFADHLCTALDQREILTYKKEEIFPVGESPYASHLKAIEKSRMAVIIFSKNYADSSTCFEELVRILNCVRERGQMIIIPIFYHVHPSDVRKQKGIYGAAFMQHELENESKVNLWRYALVDATNHFGWNIEHIANGHESKGIKLIVDGILKRLYPDKGLIGTHTRLEGLKYGDGMATFLVPSCEELEHFSFQNIKLATNNFEKSIAQGGFGFVYLGQTEKHGMVAVKQLNRSQVSGQGDHEFMMEIELLSTFKHENIVSLVGYCDERMHKILVYRYEKNGSLDNHLRKKKNLTWIQYLRICLDAAQGLEYLHDDVQHQHVIVHRDIKSSNILLDETWKAKISDFGLSRISRANVPCSVIFSIACGTRGYIDPLYIERNTLTQKSDVYSFGIVMFEVLFGRLVKDTPAEYLDEHCFSVKLAQNHYEKDKLEEIIDSDLRTQMNSDSLTTFSSIAYQCLKKRREERPKMSQVVDQLEKALDYQQGTSGFLYDVYVSFRARDSECHIVDDIRAALKQEGISTNNDDETQARKESTLLKAIERSRLFVIIFTKKFAVNPWYLDEVAKIIECMREKGQFVLPVFYNVSHYDVRTQKGYFGEVMSEFDTHPRMEVWRNALVEATNAPGLEYSNFWCSADLVKKIVEEIKSGLPAQVN